MINYLNGTKEKYLTLSDDYLKVIKWYVDTSFEVHPDSKSHTGTIMTIRQGVMQPVSRKHKLNASISTEAKLVNVDNASVNILWKVLCI